MLVGPETELQTVRRRQELDRGGCQPIGVLCIGRILASSFVVSPLLCVSFVVPLQYRDFEILPGGRTQHVVVLGSLAPPFYRCTNTTYVNRPK